MDGILDDLFREYILPTLGTVISALLSWLLWQTVAWLKAKVHDASFHCAIEKLARTTEDAVLEAQQTTVKTLRKEGAWTKETALQVRDNVFDVVRRHLGTKGWTELKDCLGTTDVVLEGRVHTMIESTLAKIKGGAHVPGVTNVANVMKVEGVPVEIDPEVTAVDGPKVT
jgi:hypothetical protein